MARKTLWFVVDVVVFLLMVFVIWMGIGFAWLSLHPEGIIR